MKKKLAIMVMSFGVFLISLVSLDLSIDSGGNDFFITSIISNSLAQASVDPDLCDPMTDQCGPLMGNASGTRYCCANTNSDCCYMAAC